MFYKDRKYFITYTSKEKSVVYKKTQDEKDDKLSFQ